jgi:hypothetical protein
VLQNAPGLYDFDIHRTRVIVDLDYMEHVGASYCPDEIAGLGLSCFVGHFLSPEIVVIQVQELNDQSDTFGNSRLVNIDNGCLRCD